MTITRFVVLPLLLASSALALHATTADTLEWHPDAGQTLRREFITRPLLTAESMTSRRGDQETISQRVFDLRTTQTLRTSDQLLEVERGRPLKMRRYYDEARLTGISETSGGGKMTRDDRVSGDSRSQGLGVVFTWVPEDQEYGRYFDSLEGVEESLPELTEDLDFRCLLPAEPVEVGSSWNLPPGALRDVVSPGGNLDYDLTEAQDRLLVRTIRQGTGGYTYEIFGGTEEGTVKATWEKTEEVDGHRLAVIKLEFDVTVSRDLKSLANHARTPEEVGAGFLVDKGMVTLALKGGGIVRWDLERGHLFDSVDLKAEERLTTHFIFTRGGGETKETSEQELVMIGTLLLEASVTADE